MQNVFDDSDSDVICMDWKDSHGVSKYGPDGDLDTEHSEDTNNTIPNNIIQNDNSTDEPDPFACTLMEEEQINIMLQNGFGIIGNVHSKLEIRQSLLVGAGNGVFLRDGEVLHEGECITCYSGHNVASTQGLSDEVALRTLSVSHIHTVGDIIAIDGHGYGSFINSSVMNRTLSLMRCVHYNDTIYFMVRHCTNYPLVGPVELYIQAGLSWWATLKRYRKTHPNV